MNEKNELKVGDTIKCKDWKDLKKTMLELAKGGYVCEVKGWDQMRRNAFTIIKVPEVKA